MTPDQIEYLIPSIGPFAVQSCEVVEARNGLGEQIVMIAGWMRGWPEDEIRILLAVNPRVLLDRRDQGAITRCSVKTPRTQGFIPCMLHHVPGNVLDLTVTAALADIPRWMRNAS